MDWTEYAAVVAEYKKRVGGRPPTMLTEQGALEYMRRQLVEHPAPPDPRETGRPAKPG